MKLSFRIGFQEIFLFMVMLCSIDLIDMVHSEIIFCISFFLIIAYYIRNFNSLTITSKRFVLVLYTYIFVIVVYKLLNVSSSSFSDLSIFISWALITIGCIHLLNVRSYSAKKKDSFFYCIFVLTLFRVLLLCIQGLMLDSSVRSSSAETLNNAPYSTMIMFFSGICLIWFLNDRKKSHRILSVLGLALSIYANFFLLQRAITIILSVIMYILIVLFNSRRRRFVYALAIVAIIALLYVYLSGNYLEYFDDIISFLSYRSDRLYRRFVEIRSFLISGDIAQSGGFSGRFQLMERSLNSWLSSPISFIFGIGDHRSTNLLIGNHCEMVDVLGRYGLIGGALLFGCLKYQYVFLKEYMCSYNILTDKLKRQCLVIIFILILRNFLGDTFYYNVAIEVMFLLPLMYDMCQKSTIQGE